MPIIEMEGPPPGGPRAGRPPWVERGWDEETGRWENDSHVGKMLIALKSFASQKNAATYGGVSAATFQNWMARGREHDPDGEMIRDEIDRTALPYVDFVRQVDLARAQTEIELVAVVRSGAREDPNLALKVLGRLFPHWRETAALDLSVIEEPADGLGEAMMRNPDVAAAAAAYAIALNEAGAFDSEDSD